MADATMYNHVMRNINPLTEVAGGSGFLKSTLEAFKFPTATHTILIDMAGYDGFPALFCVEDLYLKQVADLGASYSSLYRNHPHSMYLYTHMLNLTQESEHV